MILLPVFVLLMFLTAVLNNLMHLHLDNHSSIDRHTADDVQQYAISKVRFFRIHNSKHLLHTVVLHVSKNTRNQQT